MIIKVCLPSGDRMDVIIMLIASPAMAEHNSPANFQLMITSNETIIKLGYLLLLGNVIVDSIQKMLFIHCGSPKNSLKTYSFMNFSLAYQMFLKSVATIKERCNTRE